MDNTSGAPGANDPLPGEVMAHTGSCPVLGVRYTIARCGLMAERYPWQATLALLVTVGATWLCSYFGLTVLGALILYAVYGED